MERPIQRPCLELGVPLLEALEPGRGVEPEGGHPQVMGRSCWDSTGRPRGLALGLLSKHANTMSTLTS